MRVTDRPRHFGLSYSAVQSPWRILIACICIGSSPSRFQRSRACATGSTVRMGAG